MHPSRYRAAAWAVMLISMTGCVANQDLLQLQERVKTLERFRTEALARQGEVEDGLTSARTSESAIRSEYAALRAQVDALLTRLQEVDGRFEEVEYQGNRRAADRLADREAQVGLKSDVASLSRKLDELRQYVGFESTPKVASPEAKAASAARPQVPAPEETAGPETTVKEVVVEGPDALYAAAKQQLDNGELERARAGFQEILKRFPDSEKGDNAQFWIGEIYYRGDWFEKAILEYQKVIENYPDGNKIPAALLKQGLAFQKLGQKSNARLILEELIRKYPGSNESVIAQRKLRQF